MDDVTDRPLVAGCRHHVSTDFTFDLLPKQAGPDSRKWIQDWFSFHFVPAQFQLSSKRHFWIYFKGLKKIVYLTNKEFHSVAAKKAEQWAKTNASSTSESVLSSATSCLRRLLVNWCLIFSGTRKSFSSFSSTLCASLPVCFHQHSCF